jgi:flavin-dependent dehydrogenase
MYDAIVLGARCAGSPTAMLLARKGYRVLLVDKARFPSDIMSTHYIHQAGVARLKRWGLLERLRSSNCPPCPSITFDVGPFALKGFPPPLEGVADGFCPRRPVLDKILFDAAVGAGVEVRERFIVEGMTEENGRVSGIRGRALDGGVASELAEIVIGADGAHSLVARSVKAQEYDTTPALACMYYSYWSGVPIDGVELYIREKRFAGGFPTNDGLACVFVYWTAQEFQAFRADVEGNFLRTLDAAPAFAERVRQGKREERFTGTVDLRNFFRKPHGPGWALVGDAGYHKDPCTGQGITDAFRDAELLAVAIDTGLSPGGNLDDSLASYESRRNDAARPMYFATCQRATLAAPPPEIQELFGALRNNQTEIDRMAGVEAGTVPFTEFYTEANVGRIVNAARGAGSR